MTRGTNQHVGVCGRLFWRKIRIFAASSFNTREKLSIIKRSLYYSYLYVGGIKFCADVYISVGG